MVIGMASIGLDITDRRMLERAILELGAREQERVARELHEGLGQDLFGVALYASSMATGVDRGALPTAADLEHLATMTSTAIGTCRTMAHGLSPNSHMEGGLVEALRRMTALPRHERGREIRYVVIGQCPIELPLEELDHLYRIVKEAFTNAVKHAKASEIVVRLEILPETLRVTVLDNGIGLPTRRGATGGVGLKAMEYRADLLHARFRLGQLEPNGTQMVCETQHGKRRN
jgi:signal transduction histidine kinase